jgi:hypothetical protein
VIQKYVSPDENIKINMASLVRKQNFDGQFKNNAHRKHRKLYSITEDMKIPKMFFTEVLQI